MKRLILSAAVAALTLSPSLVRAEDSAAVIAACLEGQYAMVRVALEREVREAAKDSGNVDPTPVLADLDKLMASLEEGISVMASLAVKDRYATLNMAQNAFGGDDSVQRKIRRAIEVCLL